MRYSGFAALAARASGVDEIASRALLRPLQRANVIPPLRNVPRAQAHLTARQAAAGLTVMLTTDRPSLALEKLARYGGLKCIEPVVLEPNDPVRYASISGAPPAWTSTCTLAPGHTALNLLEALLTDAMEGRQEWGGVALPFIELRSYAPAPRIELRLAQEGRDCLDEGGLLADALKPLAGLRATYAPPFRFYPNILDEVAEAGRSLLGERHSAISTERAFGLDLVYEFGRAMAEDAS
jgi:hypothetical protein